MNRTQRLTTLAGMIALAGGLWLRFGPGLSTPITAAASPPGELRSRDKQPAQEQPGDSIDIREIVARNAFRLQRQPSAARYRLPLPPGSELPPRAPEHTEQSNPVPDFRLRGIVNARSGSGMAAVSAGGESARLLSVGDSLLGFELVWIRAGEAQLSRTDTTIILRLDGQQLP